MPYQDYKQESRKDWGVNQDAEAKLTLDQIKAGAILRIADSLERMEKPFADLIAENQRLKDSKNYWVARCNTLKRSVNAYKGIVKKKKS
jgi:hypothetical protein